MALRVYNSLGQQLVSPAVTPGGSWEFIEKKVASASATIDFDLPSGYSSYLLVMRGVQPVTDDVEAWLRISDDGGATFEADASDYAWAVGANTAAGGVADIGSTGDTKIVMSRQAATAGVGNLTNEYFDGTVLISNARDSGLATRFQFANSYYQASGVLVHTRGTGHSTVAALNDAVRFLFESGNITSGDFMLYGLKEDASAGKVIAGNPGEWKHIETKDAASSAQIDFDLPAGYTAYRLIVSALVPGTDDDEVYIRLSNDGGSTFRAGASDYSYIRKARFGATDLDANNNAANAIFGPGTAAAGQGVGSGSGEQAHLDMTILGARDSARGTCVQGLGNWHNTDVGILTVLGMNNTAEVNDAIRVLMASGNIASGKFILQGLVA